MMFELRDTSQFRKDVEKLQKQGKDIKKLRAALVLLQQGNSLPSQLHDHKLAGKWKGCRDLHISGDWILIYETEGNSITLHRTGSHSEIYSR